MIGRGNGRNVTDWEQAARVGISRGLVPRRELRRVHSKIMFHAMER